MRIFDRLHQVTPVFLMSSLLLSGCGGNEAETDSSAETAAAAEAESEGAEAQPEAAAPAPAAASPGTSAYAPLSPEDIARWEKGMDAERQAVLAGGEKLRSAATGEDSANAMMAVQEMSTADEGAQGAGLDEERYKFIRSKLSAMAAYLAPNGGMDTLLSQAQRDELRQGREAQIKRMEKDVPPDVVAALEPRAAELRTKSLELVGERFKAAGIR